MLRYLLCLMLAASALAARPPTPRAAHTARVAAEEAIYRAPPVCRLDALCPLTARYGRHGGCIHGAEAAVESWRGTGASGWVIVLPETRYRLGHALAWLAHPDGLGGWWVDPRSEEWSPLQWALSPEVASERWRRSPGPPRHSGSGVMP